ncbi:MAG TPA: hypothetical protein DDW52_24575 [Planctomycetaceae bacterium]|nr:hypothetical protein [Planctomycetaceae bacterium]
MRESSSPAHILITGGLGCIGSETAKWLLRETNSHVVVASRSVTPERVEGVFGDEFSAQLGARLTAAKLDVRDIHATEEQLQQLSITHVIHMAALQTPDCNASRDLGLQINLAGTQNLIEAMKRTDTIQKFLFASSVAVYGPRASYPPGPVPEDAPPRPVNVYGVWKLAGEHLARLFFEESGVPTTCVRPGVLFGPGRDAGLTSAPTTAMKKVVLGESFTIPFQSRQDYQYAPDVGAAVAMACLSQDAGYHRYTLPGRSYTSAEFVDRLQLVAHEMGYDPQIAVGDQDVPFICDLEFSSFAERFSDAPLTPLKDAIRQSLAVFAKAL